AQQRFAEQMLSNFVNVAAAKPEEDFELKKLHAEIEQNRAHGTTRRTRCIPLHSIVGTARCLAGSAGLVKDDPCRTIQIIKRDHPGDRGSNSRTGTGRHFLMRLSMASY
ncbi:MAG: hypothetical protein ACE5EC_10555, partial [Phycisphaerae bacterium]